MHFLKKLQRVSVKIMLCFEVISHNFFKEKLKCINNLSCTSISLHMNWEYICNSYFIIDSDIHKGINVIPLTVRLPVFPVYSLVIKPDDTNFLAISCINRNTCLYKATVHNSIHIFTTKFNVLIECIHLKSLFTVYIIRMSHRITTPLKHSRSQKVVCVKKNKK